MRVLIDVRFSWWPLGSPAENRLCAAFKRPVDQAEVMVGGAELHVDGSQPLETAADLQLVAHPHAAVDQPGAIHPSYAGFGARAASAVGRVSVGVFDAHLRRIEVGNIAVEVGERFEAKRLAARQRVANIPLPSTVARRSSLVERTAIVPAADSDRDNDPAERAPLDQVSKCVCGILKRERLGDDGLDPP